LIKVIKTTEITSSVFYKPLSASSEITAFGVVVAIVVKGVITIGVVDESVVGVVLREVASFVSELLSSFTIG